MTDNTIFKVIEQNNALKDKHIDNNNIILGFKDFVININLNDKIIFIEDYMG